MEADPAELGWNDWYYLGRWIREDNKYRSFGGWVRQVEEHENSSYYKLIHLGYLKRAKLNADKPLHKKSGKWYRLSKEGRAAYEEYVKTPAGQRTAKMVGM